MGKVLFAQQQDKNRRAVALKVMKPGMDAAEVIGRRRG